MTTTFRRIRALAALLAVTVLLGCTGTFTPGVATLYLVFRQPAGQPLSVALMSFSVTPTDRELSLLNDLAYVFPAGQQLVAVDVLDRAEDRSEAWVLTAEQGSPRATHLHRLDLRDVPAVDGATLTSLGSVQLTDAGGIWGQDIDDSEVGNVPTACLGSLVVSPDGDRLALWDPVDPTRCSDTTGAAPFSRVYLLDTDAGPWVVTDDLGVEGDLLAPGVRPGVGDGLLLLRHPTGSDPDTAEVLQVSFDEPRPGPGSSGPQVTGLQDAAALPDGLVVLHEGDGGSTTRAVTSWQDGTAGNPRPAPANAARLHVDPLGSTNSVLTTGGNRVGVLYADGGETREVVISATDASLEALNDYALVGTAGQGVCLVDVLVASSASSCDHPSRYAAELPGVVWVEWTYAAPEAP